MIQQRTAASCVSVNGAHLSSAPRGIGTPSLRSVASVSVNLCQRKLCARSPGSTRHLPGELLDGACKRYPYALPRVRSRLAPNGARLWQAELLTEQPSKTFVWTSSIAMGAEHASSPGDV